MFYVIITGNFERFQYVNFETKVPFWDESTKVENATFLYKTALSEANGKAKKVSTKLTKKERSFSGSYFIFSKIFFVPTTQMPICILYESVGVSFEGAFSLWVSLSMKLAWNIKRLKFSYLLFQYNKFIRKDLFQKYLLILPVAKEMINFFGITWIIMVL